jgi:CubicO group peptidase (beta-lactamase class C family)
LALHTMSKAMIAQDRIARVLSDLRPETAVPARESPVQTLAQRMQYYATPGASIGVIDDGALAWASGFGVRMMGMADAVTATTPFQAGSISKPVFALAVMHLVEQGALDLDADVNGYLTSWRVPANGGWQPRITLRQLLSHTAGTTVHGFRGYPASGPWPTPLEVLQGVPPANTPEVIVDLMPGLAFRYSGGGTTIAQQVVVDVLGRPFPDLMRELILDPLGMADSTFEQPLPAPMAARAAVGHPLNGQPLSGGAHVYPEMAAAGLWTTAADLSRLAIALMRTLRGERSALPLNTESVQSMLQPQLSDQTIGEHFVGIGWYCSGEGDDFCFGHQGVDEGFLAEMRVLPARGKAAAVLINAHGWLLPVEIFKAIGREYGWPATPLRAASIAMPPGIDYAGSYRSEHDVLVLVTQSADGLALRLGGQTPVPLAPSSEMEFHAVVLNLFVHFETESDRVVTAMTLMQHDREIRLIRDR